MLLHIKYTLGLDDHPYKASNSMNTLGEIEWESIGQRELED